MKREAKKYLYDIQISINDIESFIADIHNFESFSNDRKTYSAVERQLIIIGEAIHKFRNLEPEFQINNIEKIYGLRNRLVHAYDSIDEATLYSIVKIHVPKLKEEIDKLISDSSGTDI